MLASAYDLHPLVFFLLIQQMHLSAMLLHDRSEHLIIVVMHSRPTVSPVRLSCVLVPD